jgi:hypothetical protein
LSRDFSNFIPGFFTKNAVFRGNFGISGGEKTIFARQNPGCAKKREKSVVIFDCCPFIWYTVPDSIIYKGVPYEKSK